MSDNPKRLSGAALAAYDSGCGQRGLSHHKENPYPAETDAARHQAFEDGWNKTDREANAAGSVR